MSLLSSAFHFESVSSGTMEQSSLHAACSTRLLDWVPFIRSLKMQSEEKVSHMTWSTSAEGTSREVTTEDIPKEKVVKYIAEGNYKLYV